MKEEWKVYIKGVPERGKEVIKTLTDLGAENLSKYVGSDLDRIYYIGHDGNIKLLPLDLEFTQIIIDNYKEIKLPEWKDGDILIQTNDNGFINYAVYKESKGLNEYMLAYISVNKCTYGTNIIIYKDDNWKLASNEECKQFYKLLHYHHKDWDVKKKQLITWRWKPERNDRYWIIEPDGSIDSYLWYDDPKDKSQFNFGNCFNTEEEAEFMAEKVKTLLKIRL